MNSGSFKKVTYKLFPLQIIYMYKQGLALDMPQKQPDQIWVLYSNTWNYLTVCKIMIDIK